MDASTIIWLVILFFLFGGGTVIKKILDGRRKVGRLKAENKSLRQQLEVLQEKTAETPSERRMLAYGLAFDYIQPKAIPVRENRALINEVRVELGADPLVDTVTDVLRLACALSGGDVTLVENTRFKSFTRRVRRVLLKALHDIVAAKPTKLGDVGQYCEQWKRLGGLLHPYEYPKYSGAISVFTVARGDVKVPSTAALLEQAVAAGDPVGAAALLRKVAPGVLYRSADRLMRQTQNRDDQHDIAREVYAAAAGNVSSRVLLSLREHVMNRRVNLTGTRLFVNQSGRGIVVPDERAPISSGVLWHLANMLDVEISNRIAAGRPWVVDPAMRGVALPISGRTVAGGVGSLPRGSILPVDRDTLRFFVYWHENERITDFDLSALMLTNDFRYYDQVSFTQLRGGRWAAHSGDITEAPMGASEFIDIDLSKAPCDVIVPQVNIWGGEGFDEVKESFFGFMLRDRIQDGKPFEPRTVRMKSDLRGGGRVALPMMFVREKTGWQGKWLNMNLAGRGGGWGYGHNRVENNKATTTDLVRAVASKKYLTVGYIAGLMGADTEVKGDEPVVYVGFEAPENLPKGSTVITLTKLVDLIPA